MAKPTCRFGRVRGGARKGRCRKRKPTNLRYRDASRSVQAASRWLPKKAKARAVEAVASPAVLPAAPPIVKTKKPPSNRKKPHCVRVRGGKTVSCHTTAKAAYNKAVKLRARGTNAIVRVSAVAGLR